MTFSPTANMLAAAIDNSGMTQREIADRVGFNHPNILSMLKQGDTRVPLNRIPALAQTLGMDQRRFLLLAIEEYHPGVHEVLCDVLGLPLTDAEMGSCECCQGSTPVSAFVRGTLGGNGAREQENV